MIEVFASTHPKMPLILNHAISSRLATASKKSVVAGISATLLLGAVAAFGTAPSTVTYSGRFQDVAEKITVSPLFRMETPVQHQTREIRIQHGDTIFTLLSRLGVRNTEIVGYLRSTPKTESVFRQLAPGKTLTAQISETGDLESLIFPLSGSKDTVLMVERSDDGYRAEQREMEFESRTVVQSAVIRHSLFGAADDAGIPETVAAQLADIFGSDIDFHRDLRKGDRFSVVYETISHQGKTVRLQRILAAEFVNDGKTYAAFWHQAEDGSGGYYTQEGKSIRKAFLRSPLEFSRITSGFSNARFHPVLKETRAHHGIDYGAPVGTRVKATGDGVVEFAGTQGGYGKVIRIRHGGDKTTVYGHLSGFAAGIRAGSRIAQGEVIGFVGATGLATGPHLHYEFRIGGVHKNPLAVVLPPAPPLPQSRTKAFQARADELMGQIALVREMQLVRLD